MSFEFLVYKYLKKKTLEMLCVNHLAEVEIQIAPRVHFDCCSVPPLRLSWSQCGRYVPSVHYKQTAGSFFECAANFARLSDRGCGRNLLLSWSEQEVGRHAARYDGAVTLRQ